MSFNTKIRSALLFTGLAALLFTVAAYLPPFSGFAHFINDLSSRYTYYLSRNPSKPRKIVTIAVDDYSLRMMPDRWPWQRSLYARLIDTVSALGADTIAFDFIFSGTSADPVEDAALARSIAASRAKILLAYGIDSAKAELILPPDEIAHNASLGMLNSPLDGDEKTRRVRGFITIEDRFYYSLSVQSAAAVVRKDPGEIVSHLPLLGDMTFPVNFLVKPGDPSVKEISFYDLLEKQGELRKNLGDDFLKGAFVLVFPKAEILHDQLLTPVGKIPGAYLHLNGMLDILEGKVLRRDHLLPVVLSLAAFALLFFVFGNSGALVALTLSMGLLFTGFWLQVMLRLKNLEFDLSPAALFIISFTVFFFCWKYLYFISRLFAIKSKVTLDPVKELYTSRYFFYRLDLERENVRFSSSRHLFLVQFRGLGGALKERELAGQKKAWERIRREIAFKNSFWSSFSAEELIGCVFLPAAKTERELFALRERLAQALSELELACGVRCAALKISRERITREMIVPLFFRLKSAERDNVVFGPENAAMTGEFARGRAREETGFLEGLDEDIEEKNQQLLAALSNLNKEYTKSREVYFQVISSLVNALEARDPYTQGHSERVGIYAMMLARRIGWSEEEIDKLRKAALLHDLGKIGIADQVLHKRGRLTDEEFEIIKQHEIIGVKILEPIKEFAEILPWILHHHERWNGGGYPHGLAGDAIPAASQILTLADVCDALLTGRDYKLALSFEDTVAELERSKGSYFNPKLTDLFIALLREQRGKNNLLFKTNMLE